MAVFLVVTSYTLAGGFRAVVLTDAVQGLLMAVGAVVMLVAVLYQGGGLPAVLEELRAQKPEPWPWRGEMPLIAILGLSLASGMKLLVGRGYVLAPRQCGRGARLCVGWLCRCSGLVLRQTRGLDDLA